ncbi:MAG: hypothetical protein M1594_02640 [Candidatus Marsarchaeota archaeon]|nr:hypothetical protein [Candidatus Marsarchaeota archaeon]
MILELLAIIIIALLVSAPGIIFCFALLKGVDLNRFEKTIIGVLLGLFIPPLMSFFEFIVFGWLFNVWIFFLNTVVFLAISIVLFYTQKINFSFDFKSFDFSKIDSKSLVNFIKNNKVMLILAALMLLGFYARSATPSTNFFEFDPYYYMRVTEQLVNWGVPLLHSMDVYYPLGSTYREFPLVSYMTGGWFDLFNLFTNSSFSLNNLILTSNVYPPLFGALMAFFAFLFIKEEYGKRAGLLAAGITAFMPQLIEKFAFGEALLEPMGIFIAIAVFAFYALAVKRKSLRLGFIAAFMFAATLLASAEYVWPFMVISVYMLIQSFIDFWNGDLDDRMALINILMGVAALIAYAASFIYGITRAPSNSMVLTFFAIAPSILFFIINKFKLAEKKESKKLVFGGIIAFVVLVLVLTPIGYKLYEYANGLTGFATNSNFVSKTVAEQSPTTSGVFPSSMGIIDPNIILLITTIVMILTACFIIYKKNKREGLIAGGVSFILLVFHDFLDPVASWLFSTGTSSSNLAHFIIESSIFWYVAILFVLFILVQFYEPRKHRLQLLFVVSIFPVAYIGLSIMKYLVHLGAVLAVAGGVLFGEAVNLTGDISNYFKLGGEYNNIVLTGMTFISIVLIALLVTGVPPWPQQSKPYPAVGFFDSCTGGSNSIMCQLQSSRISQDWLDAMSWLNNNTNMYNASIQQNCIANYGYTCRVISWWDYGHWTTFFGNTQSVLDPFNRYEFMDQEVANDFVGTNESNLVNSMLYFHASHIEVDFELIQKWGALVYLAGTCTYNNTATGGIALGCPDQLRITDWQAGPGQSIFEFLHYPEYLQVVGTCPLSSSMYAVKSNFDSSSTPYDYCMSQSELVPVVNNNLNLAGAKPLVLVNLLTPVENLNNNTVYLLPIQQGVFVNANPQLQSSYGSNEFFNSMFARLYFFSNLPGFTLSYVSPNGEVKIFSLNYTAYENYANSISSSSSNASNSLSNLPLNSSSSLNSSNSSIPESNSSILNKTSQNLTSNSS